MEISPITDIYSPSNIVNAEIASYMASLMYPVRAVKDTKVDESERKNYRVNETEKVSDGMLELFIGRFLDLKG